MSRTVFQVAYLYEGHSSRYSSYDAHVVDGPFDDCVGAALEIVRRILYTSLSTIEALSLL